MRCWLKPLLDECNGLLASVEISRCKPTFYSLCDALPPRKPEPNKSVDGYELGHSSCTYKSLLCDHKRVFRSTEVFRMQKHNLNVLIEYDDERFSPKVLMNEPGYRMVLLSIRAGQSIPEHASKGMVTVHVILGHVTLFAGCVPDELYAGEVICIESDVRHRIEALEDSALLVLSTGGLHSSTGPAKELDLCRVPKTQRHALVFETFDALALGDSFVLTTDHNPVLLSRDIENTRPGQAIWEHLDRGPVKYRIRIRRAALAHNSDSLIGRRPEELVHEIHNI